jgi:hypothetical protein
MRYMIAVNNADFLRGVFGTGDTVGKFAYTSFDKAPDLADGRHWKAKLLPLGKTPKLSSVRNNYFGTAVVRNARDTENFIRHVVVVLDDAEESAIKLPPTYKLETSANNYQYGFAIVDSPQSRDVSYVQRSIKALVAAKLMKVDKSGNNPVRWVRLPCGANTKADNVDANGKPFSCVLREFEPGRRYSLDDLLSAHGLTLSANGVDKPKDSAERATDLESQIRILTTAAPGVHDAQASLGMKLIVSGMNPAFAKHMLEALTCDDRTERMQGRRADIGRIIDSAVEKARTLEFEPMQTDTASALLLRTFQPIDWVIEKILPPGIFILAAAPKVGKSWLIMQSGTGIASRGDFLGFQCAQGDALYLALEDNDRRMQKRLLAQGAVSLDIAALARFHYKTQWPRLNEGGAEALDQWIAEHPGTRLVAIDLLENFRAPRKAKIDPYSQDYDALKAIRELSRKYQAIAFVFVHHTRKMSATDPLDEISGTQGIAGSADGVLVLKRPRGESRGELHVIGRDIEDDGAYVVEFMKSNCKWNMVGPASQVETGAGRVAVLEALEKLGGTALLDDLVLQTGKKRQYVFRILGELIERGRVSRPARGRYEIAPIGL